jgi:hypothetical protein
MNLINEKLPSFNSAQKQRLARQLQRRMAGKSIVEFSSENDLSVSWLSKALNLQLNSKPLRRTLNKIVSPEIGMVNGVTLKELYENCGYELPEEMDISRSMDATATPTGLSAGYDASHNDASHNDASHSDASHNDDSYGCILDGVAALADTSDSADMSDTLNTLDIPNIPDHLIRRAAAKYYVGSYIEGLRMFLDAWDKFGNNPEVEIRRKAENALFTIRDDSFVSDDEQLTEADKADVSSVPVDTPKQSFNAICIPGFCQDEFAAGILKGELLSRMLKAIGIAEKSELGIKGTCFYVLVDNREIFEFCCDSDTFPKLSSQNLIVLLADETHSEFVDKSERLSDERTIARFPKLM